MNFHFKNVGIEIYFSDLIVGAPHEGPGAVYVYLGSEDGVIQSPSQIISAEGFVGLSGKPLAGFGISISRSVDVDGNHYPGGFLHIANCSN